MKYYNKLEYYNVISEFHTKISKYIKIANIKLIMSETSTIQIAEKYYILIMCIVYENIGVETVYKLNQCFSQITLYFFKKIMKLTVWLDLYY